MAVCTCVAWVWHGRLIVLSVVVCFTRLFKVVAIVLTWFIENRHPQIKGKSVIELGSGVGLCSIAAAICGAHVVSTDGDETSLNLIDENIERNKNLTIEGSIKT